MEKNTDVFLKNVFLTEERHGHLGWRGNE